MNAKGTSFGIAALSPTPTRLSAIARPDAVVEQSRQVH
jgi:hypothetical protein